MAQGFVTYNQPNAGFNVTEGVRPLDGWQFFEDFNGSMQLLRVAGGADDISRLGYPGVLCSSDGTAANSVALAAGAESGGTVVVTSANTTACGITVPTALVDPDTQKFYMECRVKIADIATGAFFWGLSESISPAAQIDANGIAAANGLDRIAVTWDTGTTTDGNLEYLISLSTDETASGAGGLPAAATMSAATYHRIGIAGNGKAAGDLEISFFFDDALVETVTPASNSVSDQLLAPMLAVYDDETVMEVDYIYVACERTQ